MSLQLSKKTVIALAIAATSASFSIAAQAEYVCKHPATAWDQKACELAKKDSPKELVQYVQHTQGVYGMYVNDYVSAKDVEHWELARANSDKSQDVAVNTNATQQLAAK